MATAATTMPSSISSVSTDRNRTDSEAGPTGFVAVNGSAAQSRESSATSPDVSPKQNSNSVHRHAPSTNGHLNGHDTIHKRKRSRSSDHSISPPSRRYDYNPPVSDDQQRMADTALHVLDGSTHAPRAYYQPPPVAQRRPEYPYEHPHAEPVSNGNSSAHPDSRLGEAFQHERDDRPRYAGSVDSNTHETPDPKQGANVDGQGSQQTNQKRKRNFSNRTKTGCITCRQRKKKCDEGRPNCSNCIRGGFGCGGYNNNRQGTSTWPAKPTPTKPPMLQSKNDESPYGEATETPISATPGYDGRPMTSMDGLDQSRPYAAESRPQYAPNQQPSWSQPQQGHQHPPPSYGPDHPPPFSELSRPESQQKQDYSATPSREMSRPPTHSNPASGAPLSASAPPHSWQQVPPPHQQQQPPPQHPPPPPQNPPPPQQSQPPPPTHSDYRSVPYPPRIDTQQPAPPARMPSASTYSVNSATKNFTAEEVERSKMLRGAIYNYLDPTLRNERQRCASALRRYNHAVMLESGISTEEARALLTKVVDPFKDNNHSFKAPCKESGVISPGVVIEEGFRCTYGYNLRIMDNAFVGEQTRIDDSGKVEIGARTWIGANVTILTNDVTKDLNGRKGADGQMCIAKGVKIGSEVIIGAGAVIYPDVRIGRGATVEPYAIVRQSVNEHATVRAGNAPAMHGPGPMGMVMMG